MRGKSIKIMYEQCPRGPRACPQKVFVLAHKMDHIDYKGRYFYPVRPQAARNAWGKT